MRSEDNTLDTAQILSRPKESGFDTLDVYFEEIYLIDFKPIKKSPPSDGRNIHASLGNNRDAFCITKARQAYGLRVGNRHWKRAVIFELGDCIRKTFENAGLDFDTQIIGLTIQVDSLISVTNPDINN